MNSTQTTLHAEAPNVSLKWTAYSPTYEIRFILLLSLYFRRGVTFKVSCDGGSAFPSYSKHRWHFER